MSRYIAVIHSWHVSSKGFFSRELSAASKSEAEGQAALLAMGQQGSCRSADYHLVEIGDRDCLLPRRLTWKERLTGQLEPRP